MLRHDSAVFMLKFTQYLNSDFYKRVVSDVGTDFMSGQEILLKIVKK